MRRSGSAPRSAERGSPRQQEIRCLRAHAHRSGQRLGGRPSFWHDRPMPLRENGQRGNGWSKCWLARAEITKRMARGVETLEVHPTSSTCKAQPRHRAPNLWRLTACK